ncbi:MAG: rod shape-determining protein MreC [bacterium]|nr:rod shape-determining protein MreC [bacterium]
MTNYWLRPRNKTKTFALAAILIVLFLIIVNLRDTRPYLQNIFFTASTPIEKILLKTGQKLKSFTDRIIEINSASRQNKDLQSENQILKARIARLKSLETENESLRMALSLGLEKEFQFIMAEIVSQNPSTGTIIINRGATDGVTEGQIIISPQKALIGKIDQVFRDFSRVILISNKNMSFDASVINAANEKSVKGVIKGQGNLNLIIDLISQEETIAPGNLVTTTSFSGQFPKGLLIGEIAKINFSDVQPFQTAQVKPLFDLAVLGTVFIIIGQ